MRPLVKSVLAPLAAIVVVTAVLAVHWVIHSSKHPVDTATILAADFGAAAIALSLLTGICTWWLKGRGGPAAAAGTLAQVTAAADWLAGEGARRWQQEAEKRRIFTHGLVTVCWRWAAAELTAPRQELTVPPVPGTGPAELPDLGHPGELLGSGVVELLHDEVYARLPYGRLVLIGEPGAGKTAGMILLLLAALHKRAGMPGDQQARVPVPVWLTLGEWDPAVSSLREWAARTMNRDYPALRAPDYGRHAAGELVRSGRVALFLDGLDDMPASMRALVLRRVDEEAKDLRVVITSRPLEYQLALQATWPARIAVIELQPVRPAAAARYLLEGQAGRSRKRWQQVGGYLKRYPESVAARALDNPLTLSLARAAYATQDPVILTDPGTFPTAEAVREHLIDQFLVTAYPGEAQRAHAIRWLAWIAWNMGNAKDLHWWDIPGWVPRWKLRLARGLVAGLCAGLGVMSAAGLTYAYARGLAGGFVAALWPAVAAAVGIGLIAGLVTRLGVRRAAAGVGAPPRKLSDSWEIRALMAGLVLSLAAGVWAGIVAGMAEGILSGILAVVLAGGLSFGFWVLAENAVASLVQWLTSGNAELDDPVIRARFAALTVGLVGGVWGGLAVGLDLGLGVGILAFFSGRLFGMAFGARGRGGFGLAGAPQVLTPRWPRPRMLILLWLPLFPLLAPLLLNRWATPVADSLSATAASTYQADRRTSMIYACVYALLLGLPTGLVAAGVGSTSRPFLGLAWVLGLAWALAAGFVIWVMAWLAAGLVPLVNLTQLVLIRRKGRVNFGWLLEDALDRRVLRQAGSVYQFSHAALQANLARKHHESATASAR